MKNYKKGIDKQKNKAYIRYIKTRASVNESSQTLFLYHKTLINIGRRQRRHGVSSTIGAFT